MKLMQRLIECKHVTDNYQGCVLWTIKKYHFPD